MLLAATALSEIGGSESTNSTNSTAAAGPTLLEQAQPQTSVFRAASPPLCSGCILLFAVPVLPRKLDRAGLFL